MFQLSAFLSSIIFWGWLSFIVAVVIFLNMIAKLPDFIKERKAQKAEDKKLVETQAAKQHRFNAALEHEGEIRRLYGINSKELDEAKHESMRLWKEVIEGE